jgi:hypothetical protein
LKTSLARSAQKLPQHVSPCAPQLLPQAPQFGSDLRLLQTPLQAAIAQQV